MMQYDRSFFRKMHNHARVLFQISLQYYGTQLLQRGARYSAIIIICVVISAAAATAVAVVVACVCCCYSCR